MTMQRTSVVILLLVLLTLALAPPARAESISCAARPPSGPPGTAFSVTCSGLDSNTIATAYVVDPTGRVITGGQLPGFVSNIDNGSVLADENGSASFTWQSAGGLIGPEDQPGKWTWVVHEVLTDRTEAVQGQVSVELVDAPIAAAGAGQPLGAETVGPTPPKLNTLDSALAATGTLTSTVGVPPSAAPSTAVAPAAHLNVSPLFGSTFNFAATGFLPLDIVNLGVIPPAQCEPRGPQEGGNSGNPVVPGTGGDLTGPGSVQADGAGRISFSLVFTPRACPGSYSVTARSLNSGAAGSSDIRVVPDSAAAGPTLSVTPDTVTALAPFLTLLGSGLFPSSRIACQAVSPGGNIFSLGSSIVDSSGNFALASPGSDLQDPGIWYARCLTADGDQTATASFMVTGLTSDP